MTANLCEPMERDVELLENNVRCQNTCAAHTDVPRYVALIAEGKFLEAYDLIRETNPFPSICGRVCHHPCETHCTRARIDAPISIDALKRFVADYAMTSGRKIRVANAPQKRQSVAIVGAGPVGLTAAHDLAKQGYTVTIYESQPEPGGMLTVGIPEYRLPKKIVKYEIDHIREHGVDIKTNTAVGKDISFEALRETYDAILIAAGAHKSLKLGIPGEDDFENVLDCIEFLKRTNLGERKPIGDKVVVIGGGNSAFDTARMALRLQPFSDRLMESGDVELEATDSARTAFRMGAKEITIVYRRSRKEMTANDWEIEEAQREGVKIHFLTAPTRILGRWDGSITGVECVRMALGEPDETGRRTPIPIKGSEFIIEADVVIPAISQTSDTSFLPESLGIKTTRFGGVAVDENTLATDVPGIFAAGDVVTGPRAVIEAIAAGHKAAASIASYLAKGDTHDLKSKEIVTLDIIPQVENERNYDSIQRQTMPTLALGSRMGVFDEVELGFTEEMAIEEAKRCLKCDHIAFTDDEKCLGCGICAEVCPYDCIKMIADDGEETDEYRPFYEGKASVRRDNALCIRCGMCVESCPNEAIYFKRYCWKKEWVTGA